MKDILRHINKAFESRVRLGIMSVLMVNNDVSFTELKEYLEVSDGNLASHISALEKLDYITITKQFKDRKPNTTYRISPLGKMAFQRHLDALEKLLNQN